MGIKDSESKVKVITIILVLELEGEGLIKKVFIQLKAKRGALVPKHLIGLIPCINKTNGGQDYTVDASNDCFEVAVTFYGEVQA